MTEHHPTIPPPELIEQWMQVHHTKYDLARQAAQWGADQELEACCEAVSHWCGNWHKDIDLPTMLRAARRPKPPSLKEEALLAIDTAVADDRLSADVANIVRRALETLND